MQAPEEEDVVKKMADSRIQADGEQTEQVEKTEQVCQAILVQGSTNGANQGSTGNKDQDSSVETGQSSVETGQYQAAEVLVDPRVHALNNPGMAEGNETMVQDNLYLQHTVDAQTAKDDSKRRKVPSTRPPKVSLYNKLLQKIDQRDKKS